MTRARANGMSITRDKTGPFEVAKLPLQEGHQEKNASSQSAAFSIEVGFERQLERNRDVILLSTVEVRPPSLNWNVDMRQLRVASSVVDNTLDPNA